MTGRSRSAFLVVAMGLCLGLLACSDDDPLPTEAATYSGSLTVTWSGPPYPQVGEVVAVVERITSSGRGPVADGTVVTFTSDPWPFDNRLTLVEVVTVDGRAVARLVADAPGTARVWATCEVDGHDFGMGSYYTLN